jgi:hypothetical protein
MDIADANPRYTPSILHLSPIRNMKSGVLLTMEEAATATRPGSTARLPRGFNHTGGHFVGFEPLHIDGRKNKATDELSS